MQTAVIHSSVFNSSMLKDYASLTKPRIGFMVLVSTSIGYFLGAGSLEPFPKLLFTLLGTFLCVAGSAVLNNFLERDFDKKMKRTAGRALPSGRITPASALSFGTTLVLCGTIILVVQVNLLTGFLALLSAFLYVLVYTPLKRITWLNTMIGAIPGALPPVGGWAAATGDISLGALALFLIMFIWQHPHFYSIAWLYRNDYRDGGFQMLPSVDTTGGRTARHIMLFSLALLPASLLPTIIGMSGVVYGCGAFGLSLYMLYAGYVFISKWDELSARGLLHASLLYLPLVLLLAVVDATVI
ncbi:MAG: heme o synthase [Bdellovibrionales bacterium]|nr:heme o synthase [Bdellovibrionales bacterium]